MFNNATLIGRVHDNLEVRTTKSGKKQLEFELIVTRNYVNQRGIREIDSFTCVAWNKAAESLAKQVQQGSLVLIRGSLKNRYNKQAVIVVEEYSVLETKGQTKGQKLRIKIPSRHYLE